MKTYLYRRVSTTGQGESEAGLSAQSTDSAEFATRNEWQIDQEITDVCSRDTLPEDRPGLSHLVSLLQPGDRVIVQKRDRLGEGFVSMLIERELEKLGVRLYSVEGFNGESPQDKFVRTVLDAVSEMEHAFTRMRTKKALKEKKAQGQTYCRRVYGFKSSKGQKLIPVEDEQNAIRLMQALHKRGESYSAIARRLDEEGYPPPCHGKQWRKKNGSAVVGQKWRHGTVKSILDRVEEANGIEAGSLC